MTTQCSIFINYRRSDAPGYVRALVSDLRHSFGSRHVFLDFATIEAGSDFTETIERAVDSCEVLLAVIGPSWLTAASAIGQPRIQDPDDFVALEIASALKRKIPVIPVLVNEAQMPERANLPHQLQSLASLQAIVMSHDRWDDDMKNLVSAIGNHTIAPRLARQYDDAKRKLKRGRWEEALSEFQAMESVQPNYADLSELIAPLRDLAQSLADLSSENRLWQRFAIKYPLLLILAVTLIPHLLAGVFNYVFNRQVIVHPMQLRGVEKADSIFETYSAVINSVFFPIGILILTFLIRPVTKGLKEVLSGLALPQERLADLRGRCIRLGHLIALVGLSMWIVAGPVYPILIGALEARDYILFISSLAISGLAVAAYPFMVVTWLCARVYYRPMLAPGLEPAHDLAVLEKVNSMKWKYFLLTGALPMLVISLGFILGPLHPSPQSVNMLLGIVGLLGLAGFLMALMLFKAIQNDLKLLRQLLWAYGTK